MELGKRELKNKWRERNMEKYVAGYMKYTESHKAEKAAYDKKRREEKREQIKESKKKYNLENRDKIRAYYANKKEKTYAYMKQWKAQNKDHINESRREYARNRMINDKEYAMKTIFRTLFRRMIKDGFNWHEFLTTYGYSLDDYEKHFTENYPNEFEQYKKTNKYHIDHIIPVAAYNFSIYEDVKNCWNPKNMRIIPAIENIKKSGTLDISIVKEYNIMNLLPKGVCIND